MLKFLIADDEENIRKGLKCIIDWEACGFKFCGEASNGKDAVSQIIDLQPDLVILDIKMPGLTGIDVLNQIMSYFTQKNLPVPAFIILSGYSDFEYAKNAINLGAKAYLLKPVDEDELQKTVTAIGKEILESRNLKEISKNAKVLETKEYLMKIIQTEKISEIKNSVDSNFFDNSENANYQAILFSLDYYPENYKSSLEKSLSNYFSFFTKVILNVNNSIVVLLKTSNETAVINCIERAAKLNTQRTYITCGQNYMGLEGIIKSYNEAFDLQKYLYYFSKLNCISIPELKKIDSNLEEKTENDQREDKNIINSFIDTLIFCIETYDKNKLEQITNQLHDTFFHIQTPESITKKNMIYCLLELRNKLVAKYPEREITDGATFDVVPQILEKNTFEESFFYLKNQLFSFIENFNFNTSDSVIIKVIAYIKSNYASDLKLETLGDMFNCNSAYLGKKFKKYTGVQFNTYLDNLRIEEAKNKLINSDLKIYQISKLVGYANTDYFFMKFKKSTGMTPKEFKNKIDMEKKLND
ncbi:MAG: response regulator [Treponema sp.]|nr:response regulator [Treponema sp.]